MKLEIITPEKALFKGEVESLSVPGSKAPFMILHNHAPIISILEKGIITYSPIGNEKESLQIEGGVVEVKKNEIIILADLE